MLDASLNTNIAFLEGTAVQQPSFALWTLEFTSRELDLGENRRDYTCWCNVCDLSSKVPRKYSRPAKGKEGSNIFVNIFWRYRLNGTTRRYPCHRSLADTRRAAEIFVLFAIPVKLPAMEEMLIFFEGKNRALDTLIGFANGRSTNSLSDWKKLFFVPIKSL